jgi:hypothetical protein
VGRALHDWFLAYLRIYCRIFYERSSKILDRFSPPGYKKFRISPREVPDVPSRVQRGLFIKEWNPTNFSSC